MSGRIRGHYRIDQLGRVEMLADVNGSAIELASHPLVAPTRRGLMPHQNRIAHYLVVGLIIIGLGGLSTSALPYLERKIANAQIAKVIATRAEIRRAHAIRTSHRLPSS